VRRLPLGGQVGDADQPRQAGRGRLRVVDQRQRRRDRPEQAVEVQRRRRRDTDRDRVRPDEQEPRRQHRRQPDELRQVEPRVEPRHQPDPAQRQVYGRVGTLPHAVQVGVGQPERANRLRAADRVEQLLLLRPDGLALLGVQRLRARHVPAHGPQLDRHGHQGGQQEPPVEHGQRAQREHHRQHRAAQLGQRLPDAFRDDRNVVRHAGGEVAGAGALELFERQPEGPLDEALTQLGQHRLTQPRHQRDADRGRDRLGERDEHQAHDGGDQLARRVARRDEVDHAAEQGSGEQADRGRRDEHRERGRRAALRPADQLADDGADPAPVGHGEEFAGHDSTAAR
jgi:hypothetical protein